MERRALRAYWLGLRPYGDVVRLQEQLHALRREGRIDDMLLLLEHEPTITLGRGTREGHVLASQAALEAQGIALEPATRGGDVTLHAPGQLVGYPILDLAPDRRDVRRYVRDLTECMRRVTLELGISAGSIERHVGLWCDQGSPAAFPGEDRALSLAKIGAIGVRISRWVTMHGFSLNLCNDLSLYQWLVPCGIAEHPVTTIAALGGRRVSPKQAARIAFEQLAQVLDANPLVLVEHEEPDLARVAARALRAALRNDQHVAET